MWRAAVELALLKEGLPYSLFAQIDDERALLYAALVRYWREKEAEAVQQVMESYRGAW